ncbi:MAG: helix-turn-helix transcriptional regulator [Burkholderiaceae bacterium]|nr:helix-turn-helix transcriptional regulator [Burkholderiaceae bacterium]
MTDRKTLLDSRMAFELVGLAYDAALQPAAWATLVGRLSDALHGATSMWVLNPTTNAVPAILHTAGYAPESVQSFQTYYWQHNVFTPGIRVLGRGVALGSELVPRDELARSVLFNEWMRPQRLRGGINLTVEGSDGSQLCFSTLCEHDHDTLDDSSRHWLEALVPHLQRAYRVGHGLHSSATVSRAAQHLVERWRVAACVVTSDLQLLDANGAADHLLRAGSALRLRHGRLAASEPASQARLRAAVAEATALPSARQAAVLALPQRNGPPVTVQIVPLPQDAEAATALPRALLLLDAAERRRPPRTEALMQRYGLTAAEARLAQLLCASVTLQEAAAGMGIKTSTARTHLQQVLAKVGVARQAQLVGALWGDLALRPLDA